MTSPTLLVATPAAQALAALHKVDLEALQHRLDPRPTHIGVDHVKDEIERLHDKRYDAFVLDQCLQGKLDHSELRDQLKRLGVQNSFLGSSEERLRELLVGHLGGSAATPQQLLRTQQLHTTRSGEYESLLGGQSWQRVEVLAQSLPTPEWEHYERHGWLKLDLHLSRKEKRMIALCHRLALCELGVVPTDASTYDHARHVLGYESSYGWLRQPACSLAQLYLATHPRVYRLKVGLYARLLLRERARGRLASMGEAAARDPVRCCVELRLQIYNTKLQVPKGEEKSFAHLDCDWKRGGVFTPAPQCLVACSDSHCDGKEIFRARFIDAEAEVEAYHAGAASGERPQKRQRCEAPYKLPRPRVGAAPRGSSSNPPQACRDFSDANPRCTGPASLREGEILLFNHLSAHEFRQMAVLQDEDATAEVPLGWTRRSEYPTLVAPHLHGVPHQSVDEVLAALLTGKPPKRWSHVYTGNTAPAAPMFVPALPALPAAPSTPLARALVGIDAWHQCPHATAWLLAHVPGTAEAHAAEECAVRQHKSVMLSEMMSALRRRVRRLATGRENKKLAAAANEGASYALRVPGLGADGVHAVPAAARAAWADPTLFPKRDKGARAGAGEGV